MKAASLATQGLRKVYRGRAVVDDVSISVEQGEIVGLLGPNGAGKTTTLRTISGLLPAIEGSVHVVGGPTDSRRPHRVARRGVAHVAEDRSLFPGLTVRENLRLSPGLKRRDRVAAYDRAVDVFPALGALMNRRAGLRLGPNDRQRATAS